MQKPKTVDSILDEIAGFSRADVPPDLDCLRKYLGHRSSLVAGKAASCAARFNFREMIGDIVPAYGRFSENAIKTDKGCVGKKAIVRALDRLEYDHVDWFLAATKCVQIEPVFGGSIDTASDVRSSAARALARFEWYKVANRLVSMFGDREPLVRIAAIETVSSFGGREAEMAVLAKTVSGDQSHEVQGVSFSALIGMNPEMSIELVAEHLNSESDDVKIEAALALGQSRNEVAMHHLSNAWDSWVRDDLKKILITAVSLLRTDAAVEFLIDLLSDTQYRTQSLEALQSYPDEVKARASELAREI